MILKELIKNLFLKSKFIGFNGRALDFTDNGFETAERDKRRPSMGTVPGAFQICHFMNYIDHFPLDQLISNHDSTSTGPTCGTVIERGDVFDIFACFCNMNELLQPKILPKMGRTPADLQHISVFNRERKPTFQQLLPCNLDLINHNWSNLNFFGKVVKLWSRVHKPFKKTFFLGGMLVDNVQVFFEVERA